MKKDKIPQDPEMEKIEDRIIANDIIETLMSTNNIMNQLHKDVWEYMSTGGLYTPGKSMKIELGFKKGEFIYKNNKTPPAEKD
jgi:hypothetical protein